MMTREEFEALETEDLQDAVDIAKGALALDSARKFGLVTGGPTVDLDRCEMVLRIGERRGVTPSEDAVERFLEATGG